MTVESNHIDLFDKIEVIADVIRGERDIERLLWAICDEVLKLFQADRVWLLYPCDPNASSWCVPIESTTLEYPGAQSLAIDQKMTPDVAEIFQTAIDNNSPVAYGPGGLPLKENTKSFAVKSQLSIAIYPRTGSPWQFGMHQCAYDRNWSKQEIKLFQTIAAMMSEALSNLLFLHGDEIFDRSRDEKGHRTSLEDIADRPKDKTTEGKNCQHCPVRDICIFGGLADEDYAQIRSSVTDLVFAKSKTIYHQEETDDFVYMIRSGLVKLEIKLPDDTKKIVRMLAKGNVLGLERLLDQSYRHSVVALQGCGVCKIPLALVQRLRKDSASLNYNLLTKWDKSVSDADKWNVKLNTGPARQRVMHLIDFLITNSDSAPEFTLPSRSDISSILGLTKETVSRVIADLRRDGTIVFYGNGIYERNSIQSSKKSR
jgi:CRP-like cAMP-binding protein